MNWKNIEINVQNIDTNTSKSFLIKMPNKSKYAGYKFWHPAKLIRNGKNSYALSLAYNDNFTFKLKKYCNGKWNKFEVIDEIEISVKEFEEAFNVMDENISEPKPDKAYLIIDEPDKVDKEVEIKYELLNDKESN